MTRTATLPALISITLIAGCATHGQRLQDRAQVFARLPAWNGLWETESAAHLLATGELLPSPLWRRPPYQAHWRHAFPVQDSGAIPADLPAGTKICEPTGFPAAMGHPVPDFQLNYVVTPEQVVIISNDGTVRHVHTDGRSHPEELWPTDEGHSIGHWEGETLVVHTVARKEGPIAPVPEAARLSAAARFTERIRMLAEDRMQVEMTITDPDRLSQPWTIVLRYQKVQDLDRMHYIRCRENDRNPSVDGSFIIAPPK